MEIFNVTLLLTFLVVACCKASNATKAINIIGKRFQGDRLPSRKALVYFTSKGEYLVGGALVTRECALSVASILKPYILGIEAIQNLRVGIGRDKINRDNFPNDYNVSRVIDTSNAQLREDLQVAAAFFTSLKQEDEMLVEFLTIKCANLPSGPKVPTYFYAWNKDGVVTPYFIDSLPLFYTPRIVHVILPDKHDRERGYPQFCAGGFVARLNIISGVASGCRPDPTTRQTALVDIIPVTGWIAANDSIAIQSIQWL